MAKKQARKNKKAGGGGSRRAGAARRAGGGRKSAARRPSGTARAATKKKTPRKSAGRPSGRARTGSTRRTGGASRGRGASRSRGAQASRSTRSATWVETPDDLDQQPGKTLATRSHDVIQRWAGERGAEPATIPGGDPGEPRVLRFNFPGFGGENLQAVSWEDWFQTFDDRNLVFLFQERLKNGNQSNFFRLDNPDREDA